MLVVQNPTCVYKVAALVLFVHLTLDPDISQSHWVLIGEEMTTAPSFVLDATNVVHLGVVLIGLLVVVVVSCKLF